ncbi:MAG: response regulator transcription factor [Acetobacterales bacterium]
MDEPHILVIDDDNRLRELLRRFLAGNGFRVTTASDAETARARLRGMRFDLLVLDVMMPGEGGLSFAETLRRTDSVPILILSAMGEASDRIAGLKSGVDDYMPKPFDPQELLLRIRSILRRAPARRGPDDALSLGTCSFDPGRGELRRGSRRVHLTESESALLSVLAEQVHEAVSREELRNRAKLQGSLRTVDVQITRLRRKLEADPRYPRYLQTVRGHGYILHPD